MSSFKSGDVVDLLVGVEVVAKGTIVSANPDGTLHGQPMPVGHVSVSVIRVIDSTAHIPHPIPHESELSTLGEVLGYVIAWPRFALAYEGIALSRSRLSNSRSRRSHSSSSRASRESRYSRTSEKDFEDEARRRGYERRESGGSSEATSGSKRKADTLRPMEIVHEEGEGNFEFQPCTQFQHEETNHHTRTEEVTPTETPLPTPMPNATPLDTQMAASTPLETPQAMPPRGSLRMPTDDLFYDLDEDGGVLSNTRGKRVFARMHELMRIYFPDDIFTDWRRQPSSSKEMLLTRLHQEFPNPEGKHFNDREMMVAMCHVLKSRRGAARRAVDSGGIKTSGLSHNDWRRVNDERQRYPSRWDQQKEANLKQRTTTGISKLGSGGKAHFRAKFEEVVGRKPTRAEYEEGRDRGMAALLHRLKNDGVVFTAKQGNEQANHLDYATGPNGEIESDSADDEDYIPSGEDTSEDDGMDSDAATSIRSNNVQHPLNSRRPHGLQ